jgi:hypothetical protein
VIQAVEPPTKSKVASNVCGRRLSRIPIFKVSPAWADDSCPQSGESNYYSLGYTRGFNAYGGHGKAPEKNYGVSDWQTNGFVVHRLLVVSGVESNYAWAEIGFGWGWHGQNIAHFYYARINPSLDYDEFKLNKTPSGAGTWHTYEIPNTSTGTWSAYIDGQWWATTAGFDTYSQWIELGMEATSSSSTVPDTPTSEHWYKTSTGYWSQWPSNSDQTKCKSDQPFQWAWSAYPNSGHFWK